MEDGLRLVALGGDSSKVSGWLDGDGGVERKRVKEGWGRFGTF